MADREVDNTSRRAAAAGVGSAARPFGVPVRVYYQDTDAGGVVYHAQYLSFMERARTELLNTHGFDLLRCAEEDRVLFMVHAIAVRYHRPAVLNDMLHVTAQLGLAGRASLKFRQRVERGAELLVEAEIKLALVDRDRMRPVRMPAQLQRLLESIK